MRRAIDTKVLQFADRLADDPEMMAKGEALKQELLEHDDVRAWLHSLWGEVKRTALAATDDPNSELRQRLDRRWCASAAGCVTSRRCRRRWTPGCSAPSATWSSTTAARWPS
jgi:uncharacterized membrane-anchored protein YjiN (DUF445 family)